MKLTSLLGFSAATAAVPAARPSPNQVLISDVTYSGSGCPPDSLVQLDIANPTSGVDFTGVASAYVAVASPEYPNDERTKACQISFALTQPEGWQYSLKRFNFEGYLILEEGVSGTGRATLSVSGGPSKTIEKVFVGPREGTYGGSEWSTPESADGDAWTTCGTQTVSTLTIDSQITLAVDSQSPSAQGFLTVDSYNGILDGVHQGLRWRRCAKE